MTTAGGGRRDADPILEAMGREAQRTGVDVNNFRGNALEGA